MFHSYCIISTSLNNPHLKKILDGYKLHQIDITYIDTDPIGILQIRKIISSLQNKPYASKYKAIVIEANNLTLEAQQALLKTLEEPPVSSLIFLVTDNIDKLLPTIVSRCSIINLNDKLYIQKTDKQKPLIFWSDFFQNSVGNRLKLAQEMSFDRKTLTEWLTEQILFFRTELKNKLTGTSELPNLSSRNMVFIIKKLILYSGFNRNNISLKLLLDQLFLSLPF